MPVEKGKDRHGEFIIVSGEVNGVYYNELSEKKTYGKGWTPTHGLKLVVDGNNISLGLVDKEDKPQLRAQDADGNYLDVFPGAKVEVEVESDGEYQGKEQFKAFPKNITVKEAVSEPKPKGKSGYSGGGFTTGMAVCHANNGATALFNDFNMDSVEAAKTIHDVTSEVKAYLEENSSLSKKDAGNWAGNAVNNAAARLKKLKKKVPGLYTTALEILEGNEALREYIETGGEPTAEAPEEAPQFTPDPEDDIPF